MQATLFTTDQLDNLTVLKPRRALLPLVQKTSEKAIKKAQQQATRDAMIDTCAHWFEIMWSFNDLAQAGKRKQGNYAHAVRKYNEAFAALMAIGLNPAEITSLCMEQLHNPEDEE